MPGKQVKNWDMYEALRGEGAVLISESEWASIEETLYLLSSPKNAQRLLEGIARLDAGEGEEHELIQP